MNKNLILSVKCDSINELSLIMELIKEATVSVSKIQSFERMEEVVVSAFDNQSYHNMNREQYMDLLSSIYDKNKGSDKIEPLKKNRLTSLNGLLREFSSEFILSYHSFSFKIDNENIIFYFPEKIDSDKLSEYIKEKISDSKGLVFSFGSVPFEKGLNYYTPSSNLRLYSYYYNGFSEYLEKNTKLVSKVESMFKGTQIKTMKDVLSNNFNWGK